ncbi:non-specific serine/threonine protein kinase [Ranunculus cassubicifolius]
MTTDTIHLFLIQSILLICITLPLTRPSTANPILGNATDRLALLSFKDSVTQYPQGRLNSWNDSLHFCDWGGVTCGHRHQRVTKLMLRSQGLTGSISPHIGNLSFLRYLNLGNNSLYGHIPPEIGRLFRLEVLLISNNSFTGQIPVNLSRCSNLEALTIGYNNLTGKIPEEFGSLSMLVVLDLHVNSLTGEIPVSLGNNTFLETIYLSTNSLEGSIPDSIGKLKSLRNFLVALNNLSGTVPPSIYNISSLEQISLAENHLAGMLPRDIGLFLPNLLEIYIGANKLFGPIPVSLFSNTSKIQKLYMGENGFTGNVPIEVGNLVSLEYLNLGQNRLGSNGKDDDLSFITSLSNCSNLQLLDVAINHLGGRLTESLANLSIELNALAIGGNPLFGSIPDDIWDASEFAKLGINWKQALWPHSLFNW